MRRWILSEQDCQLVSGDDVARLTPKAAAVLACLVRHRGRIVSREQVLSEVWSGVHVTPDLVREYVFDLRTILNDDPRAPRYIETVRGKGFRLVGDIALASADARSRDGVRRATVAVLRPEVYAEGDQWTLFADALGEDVITDLVRFPDIAVIARHSAFAIDRGTPVPEAAARLGADYVIESSVAVVADRLRASFQLIDGTTGHHEWAERYDRPVAALPGLGDEIALSVANALGGLAGQIHRIERRLVRRRQPSDFDAYQHYVRACELEHRWEAEEVRAGLSHIEQALGAESEFARAWLIRYFMALRGPVLLPERPAEAWLEIAATSIRRAWELDPRDALIAVNMAFVLTQEGDIGGAMDILHRAGELAANQADAAVLFAADIALLTGDTAVADRFLDIAYRLNPTPPDWYDLHAARVAFAAGDFERCETVTLGAPDFTHALALRCLSQALLGRTETARDTYAYLKSKFPMFSFENYLNDNPIAAANVLTRYQEGVAKIEIFA